MKWYTTAYIDNGVFDSRLVKDDLVTKWPSEGDQYVERKDYRNLMESYVPYHILTYVHYFFSFCSIAFILASFFFYYDKHLYNHCSFFIII